MGIEAREIGGVVHIKGEMSGIMSGIVGKLRLISCAALL